MRALLLLLFHQVVILLFMYCSSVTTAAAGILTGPAGTLTGPSDSGYLFHLILLLSFTLVLDIKMNSPPITPPPHGSSRMTGGIFRGNALGNALNTADFDDVVDVLHPILGKVFVYSSNQDPANLSIQDMKPSAFIKHIVTSSIKPILTKVAEKYSPIRSESLQRNNPLNC